MIRKIIKQANQAYTLTLPIEWVRKHNLKAGSEIDVSINDKNLLVSTTTPSKIIKANIKLTDSDKKLVNNYLSSLYAKGYDEIVLESDREINSEIISSINNLLGFVLVSQDKNLYIIKDINSGSYQHLDEIFKRVFQMVLLFYESAIIDVFGKEQEELDSLITRDSEVNKFCLYLQRAINKSSYPDLTKSRIIFTYSFALEKIGDEIERFWRTNIKNDIKKTAKIKELAELSKACLEKSFDLFFQYSSNFIKEIYKIRKEVREKSLNLDIKDSNTGDLIRHIIKIADESADLIHLAIMFRK